MWCNIGFCENIGASILIFEIIFITEILNNLYILSGLKYLCVHVHVCMDCMSVSIHIHGYGALCHGIHTEAIGQPWVLIFALYFKSGSLAPHVCASSAGF